MRYITLLLLRERERERETRENEVCDQYLHTFSDCMIWRMDANRARCDTVVLPPGIVIPIYAALMGVWVTLFLEFLKREQATAR